MKLLPFLIVLLIILGCKQPENTKTATNTPETSANIVKSEPVPDASITLEKFNRLKTGMTYKEAVQILGGDGEIISESEIAGIKTTMYSWQQGFSGISLMFQNGKLIQKSQFGL